jgi:hypothetical protein
MPDRRVPRIADKRPLRPDERVTHPGAAVAARPWVKHF